MLSQYSFTRYNLIDAQNVDDIRQLSTFRLLSVLCSVICMLLVYGSK